MKLCLLLLVAMNCFGAVNPKLTADEIRDGWVALYDGESLFGWRQNGSAGWESTPTGRIRARGSQAGRLEHGAAFGDFELKVAFHLESGAKAKLGLRCDGSGACGATVVLKSKPVDMSEIEIRAEGERIAAKIDGVSAEVVVGSGAKSGAVLLDVERDCEFQSVKLRPSGLGLVDQWTPKSGEKGGFVTVRRDGGVHLEGEGARANTVGNYFDFVMQVEADLHFSRATQYGRGGILLRGDAYRVALDNRYKDRDLKKPVDVGTGGIAGKQDARKIVSADRTVMILTIAVNGGHIATWVNGAQETDWTENPAAAGSGTIGLVAMDEATNLDFRRVRIGELR